ncbi:MAG: helix-turn-helix transcriptional regulator [Verrucomicrobia bacterium]|nr:helix-turn-helix transcriptional regulator [Verrucomicrobiota bacterium]
MPATRPESPPPSFLSQQVTAARRFYLDLRPRPGRDLTVVCGGWEECAPDYAIDRATFPYLSVEFVASGRGELVLGGRRHPLAPGTVFSYGPGVAQCIRTSPDARLGKYFIDFAGPRGRRLLREAGLTPGTCVELGASTEVRHAFDTLVRLGSSHDRHTPRACALQLELLLLVTRRAMQPGSLSERRALASFERCRQHLDDHFLALRSLQQAAAACHVDVSYLCRLFRRFHGERPFRYLQRLQMQWAAERLHASGRLVRQVADELGVDPFQFSRTFKRIHGVSPSAFLSTRG